MPVTTDTVTPNPSTPPLTTTMDTNPSTDTGSPPTTSTSTIPPSALGTEGVIGISVSIVGLLLLALIVLVVIVLVCFMSRRQVLNQQVGMAQEFPPNTKNNLQMVSTNIAKTDTESSDQGKQNLYSQKNLAYSAREFPSVYPVEHINEAYPHDDGYETISTPM